MPGHAATSALDRRGTYVTCPPLSQRKNTQILDEKKDILCTQTLEPKVKGN